jgi:AcrR family transcriptional regulator
MYHDPMARRTPTDRTEKLLEAAAAAFVEHGFQRTQMDDIAARLGVSKGTVYRSVDSKESLLAAVLLYADSPEMVPDTGIEPTGLADLSAIVRDRLAAATAGLELTTAAVSTIADTADFGAEVERLCVDMFEMMSAHRVRVMVLDRCAQDLPELAGDWYHAGRYAVVDLWAAYLERRADFVPASIDVEMTARTIVEIITLWAVKMPWDPAPRPYATDRAAVCAAMIRNLVTGAPT